MIIDGLDPPNEIEFAPIHVNFICGVKEPACAPLDVSTCQQAGGALGGMQEAFCSTLAFDVLSTGPDIGGLIDRRIHLTAGVETITAPRTPGASPQVFNTEMISMFGVLNDPLDPDLATVVTAWATRPTAVRAGIVATVRAVTDEADRE